MTGHPANGDMPPAPSNPFGLAAFFIAYGVVVLGVCVGILKLLEAWT